MPMTRYEIRNEYSLADPELYTAADKDDPEALLEGIAMAGLVGVLRQLGDLAEYAAEIFHELHEEVMMTAARGHNLMIRVQQLEAEVPSIEKAFLSQTDHSSFLYNAGVDWHPYLRMDQNLVTQGDLPRFIMDSYEECRGPPRLFLLDKFDVAGAGACLKRYTDPSSFKVEASSTRMNGTDTQREKKIRKAKKKGPRWRNGGTPEVLPSSHAKLHQLFMEEQVGNGKGNPERRVKLKRRLNGFPFDLKTGKSYMEKLLKTPSPEHKVFHEVTVSSPPLILPANDRNDSSLGVLQVIPVSSESETVERKGSPPTSPDRENVAQRPFIYEPNEVYTDKISKEDDSDPSIAKDDVSYSCGWVTSEKDIAVDGESRTEARLIGYQSDDVASEIDNYVDAPMTIESEMDTDSELRTKSDCSSYIKRQPTVYDANANEEQLHFHPSDSQSTGYAMLSDDGNSSIKKEMSSFLSSYFPRASADNTKSEHYGSVEDFSSADEPKIENIDVLSSLKTADEDVPVIQHPKSGVTDDSCGGTTAINNQRPEFEQLTSGWCRTDTDPILGTFGSGVDLREIVLRGPESDEKSSVSDEEVKKTNLAIDPAFSPSFSDSESLSGDSTVVKSSDFLQVDDYDQEDIRVTEPDERSSISNKEKKKNLAIDPACSISDSNSESQLGDNSPRSSAGCNLVHEPNSENEPCMSTVSEIQCHTTAVAISFDFLQEDESDLENPSLDEKIASISNSCIVLPNKNDTPQMLSSEIPVTVELGHGDLRFPENYAVDYPEMAHSGDCFVSAVPKEENPIHVLDSEDQNVFSDTSTIESSLEDEFKKISSYNAPTVDTEDHYSRGSVDNQIGSQNLILSHVECSQDLSAMELDAHEGDVFIPTKETTVNETRAIENLESCEVVGFQAKGIKDHVSYPYSASLESSCFTPENFERPLGASDTVDKDGITPCMSPGIRDHVSSPDSASLESSCSTPENFERPARTSDTVDKDGITPCMRPNGQEARELSVSQDLVSSNDETVLLDEPDSRTDQSEVVVVAATVPAVVDNVDKYDIRSPLGDTLVEEGKPCFEDIGPHKLENSRNCLSGSQGELEMLEEVDQREVAPSDLDNVFCNSSSSIEVSDTVSNPVLELAVERSLNFVNATKIQAPPERIDLDPQQKSYQPSDHANHAVHARDAEETSQEQTDLQIKQQEFLGSGEINPELLPLLTVHDQQRLDLDDHQVAGNSASKCAPLNRPDLPLQSNHEIDVSEHSEYPLGSLFRPGNYLLDKNEINLEGPPPLPPLPPVQWRMGKVQHSSSTIGTDTIQHMGFFSLGTSKPFTSTGDVNSSHEELEQPLIQIARDIASKEKKVEQSSSSLEANVRMHEIDDLPPNTENEPQQLSISSSEIGFSSAHVEDEIEIAPKIASRNDEVENSSTSLVGGVTTHETIDHKQKMENDKQDLIVPSSEIEKLPATEDGIANGSQTKKLPWPRNPLIDAVAALDRSKLRKVTERVIPETPKVDERDSLLVQIRTKSFNLKPALTTRPSFQGPKTNLKVSAILEKANAIRQALAGSDEDDEDSWSDS